ncbi:hypothetical protein XELAEV_18028237mg [Xenopus laevis]|uniref:Uncharacterized protein n=1 Tax=Xenopus laevis TaxID=8355 RepID=A0A974CZB8_XENLA|nr:hypothetical protein XELAEV_18028237mg [Xenopus laevis]
MDSSKMWKKTVIENSAEVPVYKPVERKGQNSYFKILFLQHNLHKPRMADSGAPDSFWGSTKSKIAVILFMAVVLTSLAKWQKSNFPMFTESATSTLTSHDELLELTRKVAMRFMDKMNSLQGEVLL